MKFLLVLLECLGAALAAPNGKIAPRILADDFSDILAVLPLDDLVAILYKYIETDGAVSASVVYLQAEPFHQFARDVFAKPTAQKLVEYLTAGGIPVADIVATADETIAAIVPGVPLDMTGTLRPVLDELEAIIPVDDLIAVITDKLENSPDFQEFYVNIASEDVKELVIEVIHMDEFWYILQVLTDFGQDVQGTIDLLFSVLGWGEAPK